MAAQQRSLQPLNPKGLVWFILREMPNVDSGALAREFLAAYEAGQKVGAPPSVRDAAFDLNSAYAVEAEYQRLRAEQGRAATGRKVGFANKAMWRILKLDTLVW